MVGSEIGDYRILEKVGEGGTGVVYKAQDVRLDRTVAMKELRLDFGSDPELEQRFRAEIKPLGTLYHTNLVALHALLVDQGHPWLATEFVEGETFEQMIRRRGPIPADEAIALLRQSLFGIGYGHRKGVLHRDIKPSNLIVNQDGVVKVSDFGLAKALSARGVGKAGARTGTPAYMSPEQFLNRGVDARSDIYSLGVVLYEMLAGRVPFSADNDYQIMSDHVNTPPPPPSQFAPIPRAVEVALLRALEKGQDARFRSVEEFGAALGSAQGSVAGPPVAAAVVPAPVGPAVVAPPLAISASGPTAPVAAVASGAPRRFAMNDRKLIIAAVIVIVLLGGVLLAMRIRSKMAEAKASAVATAPNDANNPNNAAQQPAGANVPPPDPNAPPPVVDNGVPPPNGVAVLPGQPDAAPADAAPADAAPAPGFMIPVGTPVFVRMNDAVSSSVNQQGENFGATVDSDVVVNGAVAVSSGSDAGVVLVKVAQVPDAPRSEVELQLIRLNINGADYRARSSVFDQLGVPPTKKGAAKAGARAAFGALGGFLSHGSAKDGAVSGAASAYIVTIAPQTRIRFTLKKAIALPQ